jgi:tetratricopeptide (TPR) repeat protein
MNRNIRRAAMAALMTATMAAAVTAFVPADAAPARNGKQDKPTANQVRPVVGKPLQEAMKLVDAKDFAGALAKVKEADAAKDKTPFEQYQISRYEGFIYINQPMPDYVAATAAYNQQIETGAAPDAEKATMYSIAMRLNYQAKDYSKVIQDGSELQKIQPIDDTGQLVLIQAYYNTMDYANAVTAAKAEVAAKQAAGTKPGEDVLGLLLNAQIRAKDEPGARQTLDIMASVSKKPEVWGQVMDFAMGQQGMSDHNLLNLYRLAVLVGTMKDMDYAAMATIDLQNGLPQEAKTVLTKANKGGDLLTQANSLAAKDQDALKDLATEAAKQTNGEIDVKLGESYYTYGRYDDAIAALQKGIQKGGLKDAADAQTTLGLVLWTAGKKAEAEAAFEKAAAAGGASGQVAHTWDLFGKREVAA